MKALYPLVREMKLRWYERARVELQQRDPTHRDLPHIVRRIHELTAERPPVEQRKRSRCAAMPGMCARDPNCEDRRCPGLHMNDGGHSYRNGVVFPIEHERTGASA